MPENEGEPTYEDLIVAIGRARLDGRLTDQMVDEIAAMFNDPLSIFPPTPDEPPPDGRKIQLIIRLGRADARGALTPERIQEVLAKLASRHDSMSPQLIVEQPAADEDDESTPDEPHPDTDPPAPPVPETELEGSEGPQDE